MSKKFSIAVSLAAMLAIIFTSLALAADPPAQVLFTTDVSCPVTVLVLDYTNLLNQSGQTASGSTPWALDTYPATSVVFFYPASVVCNGVTYSFVSASPASPLVSGAPNSNLTVTGHYLPPFSDLIPPVLTLPSDMTVNASGPAGALVSFTASANDDVDGPVPVTCLPASGSLFPLGTTPVTCSASDAHGNPASGSFNVTVIPVSDNTSPVWTVPSDLSVEATGPSGASVIYSASASDPDDEVSSQSCSPASGATFPLGTTTVNCTAMDTHGNIGTASFHVTVVDTTPPALTVPADILAEATGPAGAVVSFSVSAHDLVDGLLVPACVPVSGSTFPLGTTPVICSASDTHGNVASRGFNVTVVDTTPPALVIPANMTVIALNASGAPVTFTASAKDLVDGSVPVICSPASGLMFPLGTTTVTCTARDSHGNSASGIFTITVQYAAAGARCKGVAGHQVLQPLNIDGSSVFKQGNTVPVKFRICGADGNPIGTPGVVTNFRLVQIIRQGIATNVDVAVGSAPSQDGFRSGNGQWIFNITTKGLGAGNTYVYLITLNDGSTIQFQFTLK